MRNDQEPEKNKEVSRRKFLMGSAAAGALTLGGVLMGNKDLLAETIGGLREPRWQITVDGKVMREGTVSKSSKDELLIPVKNGTAHIVFDQGRIYMPEDNDICTKKICSLMGAITKPGESITCLPNKLVVRIL
jgi:hypothetical protein